MLEKLRGQDISEGLRVLKQKRERDRATKEAERKAAQADRAKRNLLQENLTARQKQKKARKPVKKHSCTRCGVAKGSVGYRDWEWRNKNKRAVVCLACEDGA